MTFFNCNSNILRNEVAIKFLFHRTGALATSKISLNRLSSAQRKLLSYNCSILSNEIVSKPKCKYYGGTDIANGTQFVVWRVRLPNFTAVSFVFTYRLSYGSRNPKGIFITCCEALLKFAIGNCSFKETLQIKIAQLSHFHFRSDHGLHFKLFSLSIPFQRTHHRNFYHPVRMFIL